MSTKAVDSFDLKVLFPEENVTKASPLIKLHLMIVLGKGLNEMKKLLTPNYVNRSLQERRALTPLHLCAMLGRSDVAKELFQKGADANTQDELGWTPLHFATVRSDAEMIKLLRANKARERKNQQGLTPSAMQASMQIQKPEIIPHLSLHGSPCLAQNFEEITHAQYGERGVISGEVYKHLWKMAFHTTEEDAASKLNEQPKISEIKKSREHLPDLDFRKGEGGWGLYARETIPPRQWICTYGGEYLLKDERLNEEEREYWDPPFHAYKIRGLGAQVNDGFPNCLSQCVRTEKGFEIALIAIDAIASDEQIVRGYGFSHWIKRGRYLPIGYDRYVQFLQTSLSETMDIISSGNCGKRRPEELLAKMRYVAETPILLLKAYLDGHIKIEDVKKVFEWFKVYREKVSIPRDEFYVQVECFVIKAVEHLKPSKDISVLFDSRKYDWRELLLACAMYNTPEEIVQALEDQTHLGIGAFYYYVEQGAEAFAKHYSVQNLLGSNAQFMQTLDLYYAFAAQSADQVDFSDRFMMQLQSQRAASNTVLKQVLRSLLPK